VEPSRDSLMSDQPYKRKLIEVALPLDAINAESSREKSLRHGHPSTLHLWWARRPLAACRAVLFSQLVDDPSSKPEDFPTEEDQATERARLFGILQDLVLWENTTNEEVLDRARAEVRASCGDSLPVLLEPFAGGGSIPLEGQRLGLEVKASDLNPVAVLINKALIEMPPQFGGRSPVHPQAEVRTRWDGPSGLAEDVRRYGAWLTTEAKRRIGSNYPTALAADGSSLAVIGWIWARTVTCPNPACGAAMPLCSSFWLEKSKKNLAWISPSVESNAVEFTIGHDPGGPPDSPKIGRGAKFRCLVCGQPADQGHIRGEGKAGRMGAQLVAVVAEGDKRREYLAPTAEHVAAAAVHRPADVPHGEMPDNPRWFSPPGYGMRSYTDLFSNRQLVAMKTFAGLVAEAGDLVRADALGRGFSEEEASAYERAVSLYLSFVVSRLADRGSTICSWDPNPSGYAPKIRNTFSRQALPMTWDYVEGNPFSSSTANAADAVEWVAKVIDRLPAGPAGSVEAADARRVVGPGVICTDPPYYDNIGYADLSDYFYVWLRESVGGKFPDLFATLATPKIDELIATPYRHGGSRVEAEAYFERGFVEVFATAQAASIPDFPMTLFYAFKQAEVVEGETISTGWSTMLEGLLSSGWMVTATWPMRTELANKIGMKANMLASSVVLACRRRPDSAGITDRQGFIGALSGELVTPIRNLQGAAIAPVDLRQAAIGPGMAVFSRFSRVVEPDGSEMTVRTALGIINQVLETVLGEQDSDFDLETRWAIQWFSQFLHDRGPYGTAEQLAVSMNVAVEGLASSGIVESGGGFVRLLERAEYEADWDPLVDRRKPVWEATQHLIRVLETDGEVAAARLLRRLGGIGEQCNGLAYRLFDVCESVRPQLAGPYNALAASWPEIQRLANTMSEPVGTAEQQSFDT